MDRYRAVRPVLLLAMAVFGCWRDDHPVPVGHAETPPEAWQEAFEEGRTTTQPVDFRVLRELLPGSFEGLPRRRIGGETSGALGVKVSKATAEYHAGEAGFSATAPLAVVTITDLIGLHGRSLLSYAAWVMAEIDRETETGYERTTTYKGHPAYEKFSNVRSPTSRVEVFVAERYVIEITGEAMEMHALRAALDQLDLERLERFAQHGPGEPRSR